MQYCDGTNWILMGPQSSFRKGLVGHWKLDEASGTLKDSSGYGNDGTAGGGPEYASTGIFNYAMGFDGIDDYINVADDGKFTPDSAKGFSVAAWFNAHESGESGGDDAIAAKPAEWRFIIRQGNLAVMLRNNDNTAWQPGPGPSSILLSTPVALNQWYFGVFTWDGGVARLYLDGAESDSYPATDNVFNHTSLVNIGTNFVQRLNATIDDIRIYNRALSAAEVAQLYAYGTADPCSPANSPAVGTLCDDGSILAGVSPAANKPMYVTNVNQSTAAAWSTENIDTGADSTTDGAANQQDIVANHAPISNYPAFELCENLSLHDQTDWFLPAQDELEGLYLSSAAINASAAENFTNSGYWSSSESSPSNAIRKSFGGNFFDAPVKSTNADIRCVRTGPLPLSCPAEGVISYSADTHVPIYCDGDHWVAMAPNQTAPTAGLVGHWKLDEITYTSAVDSSGFGNDGFLQGNPEFGSSGIIDYAMGFDGVDDYVLMSSASIADFDGDDNFSVSAWLKTSAWPATSSTYLNKRSGGSGNGYTLQMDSLGRVNSFYDDGPANNIRSIEQHPLNTWLHELLPIRWTGLTTI